MLTLLPRFVVLFLVGLGALIAEEPTSVSAAGKVGSQVQGLNVLAKTGSAPSVLSGQAELTEESPAAVEAFFNEGDVRRTYVLGEADRMIVQEHGPGFSGKNVYHLIQTHQGVPVRGSEMVAVSNGRGLLEAVFGAAVSTVNQPPKPRLSANRALFRAMISRFRVPGETVQWTVKPQLVYYADNGKTRLAYEAEGVFFQPEFRFERIYADAENGDYLGGFPLIHDALDRAVYTANDGCLAPFFGTALPGSVVLREGDQDGEGKALAAYDNAGDTYWFYYHMFGRDSLDGRGGTLSSTIEISFAGGLLPFNCSPNNAAFLRAPFNLMLYGDGDGNIFDTPTSYALDVTAHELTHGVTSYESNLAYRGESGAINEALSDIFAAGAEAWKNSGGSVDGNPAEIIADANTWLVGEVISGPAIGDALRYMNDPARDGRSPDFWPDRNYPNCGFPTRDNDNCGVHTNSGIGNLAFYLMVNGGTHPRGKTNIDVPAIGMEKALSIFYEANRDLLTANDNYEQLRYKTAEAAANQFGACSCEVDAVHMAWDAVGVPGSWTPCNDCGGEPPVDNGPRKLGTISIEKPAFLFLETLSDNDPAESLLICSFQPFGTDRVSVIPEIGGVVDGAQPQIRELTRNQTWPNFAGRPPAGIFDGDVLVLAGGFLVPFKGNGAVTILDPATGARTDLTNTSNWFYHHVYWRDMNGDGRLDIVTARVQPPSNGPSVGVLVWLEQPAGNPLAGPWQEHELISGPDVNFLLHDLDGDGSEEIIAAQFFTRQLTLIYQENGAYTSRTIDADLGSPFDLELSDLNRDGRLDLLVTNHEADENAAVFAYEIPVDPKTGTWTRHTLLDGIETRKEGQGQASPGQARAFFAHSDDVAGKPLIHINGDGSQRTHLLTPVSADPTDWNYTETIILETQDAVIGQTAIGDVNGDGYAELIVPAYDEDLIHIYTFAPER